MLDSINSIHFAASKVTVVVVVVSLDAVQYFLCIVKQIDGIHKNKNSQNRQSEVHRMRRGQNKAQA